LEGVKNQIEQLGGTCICVKTDVKEEKKQKNPHENQILMDKNKTNP
jgi:hypothetical protein